MTGNEPDGEWAEPRRSFASRTPVNGNPDQVVYRRGFVTRHQVTGWRFVMRRIASGIALHDTRMLVDPLRTQSRAVLMGVIILITGLAGCFVFSLMRPNGQAGNNMVLADRSTAALYVRVGDELHPVLNLTSARLIAGKPVNPTTVKSAELDRFPRGNLIGIPGAPERMVQSTSHDANWTVCDTVSGSSQGGRSVHSTGVTVIAGSPDSDGARAAALSSGHVVLVDNGSSTWLLWDGKRSRVDLADHAVTDALGLGASNTDVLAPRPIALGLFNAIPEAPPLTSPAIPNAGGQPGFGLSQPIGAVVEAYSLGKNASDTLYYAVLPDGLQSISPVLAAILRNTNSYGLQQPPRLGADEVTKLPVSRTRHMRVLEQAGRSGHQLTSLVVRRGAAGARRDTHRRLGRREQWGHRGDSNPSRAGARHWLFRPDRERRSVRTGHRVVVLGLRHRGPVRHRHRNRRWFGDCRSRQNR
jgi:type VII secretion protein EccB